MINVFTIAAASPAQIVSLQKMQGQLQDPGALETIASYLALLEDAYLVAPLPKWSGRETRRRAAPPKLVTLNNGLCAAIHPPGPSATIDGDPTRRGALVENACLAFAWGAGQKVSYGREDALEVDGVFEGSWGAWAVEIKTGRFAPRELAGLFELVTRRPSLEPLVLCDEEDVAIAERAGARARSWRRFLWEGL